MVSVKILKTFFCFFVVLTIFSFVAPALAGEGLFDLNRCTRIGKEGETPKICLQVAVGAKKDVSGIAEYISVFYNFFVGAVATLAIFMIVIGGVMWLFARGDSGRITAAKSTINSAITGMLLVFISVSLLRIINPDLISLKVPGLQGVKQKLLEEALPLGSGTEVACSIMKDQIQKLTDETGKTISYPPADPSELGCNEHFTVSKYTGNPLALRCYGEYCPGGTECLYDASQMTFRCVSSVRVAGTFQSDEKKAQEVMITLHPVCGQQNAVLPINSETFSYQYPFGVKEYQFVFSRDDMKKKCGTEEYKGIVIGVVLTNVIERSYVMRSDCQNVFVGPDGKAIRAPGSQGASNSVNLGSDLYLVDRGLAAFLCNIDLQQSRLPLF